MGIESGAAFGVHRFIMRNYLSTHHLYAARYSAEESAMREAKLAGVRSFDIRNRGYVLSAISESVAFLEATINEIYQDANDEHPTYSQQLPEQCRKLMSTAWEATANGHRLETLAKFDLALSCNTAEGFDRGVQPYQDVALLVKLRNYVTHYSPHDVGSIQEHKLAEPLRQRFIGSSLMKWSGNPWFPDHALGAPCASWSWRAARSFADDFAARMDMNLNYQLADFSDPLPE